MLPKKYKQLVTDKSTYLTNETVSINKVSLVLLSIFHAVLAVVVGILIGYYGLRFVNSDNVSDDLSNFQRLIKSEIKHENIRNNLKVLTEKPHVAGSIQDEKVLVDFVFSSLYESLENVEISSYDVLLSYPNKTNRNYIALLSNEGKIQIKSKSEEPPLTSGEDDPYVIDGFNSYSPAGHVHGNLIYVNFAKVEDFEFLKNQTIECRNMICIARYGQIFRGDKATNAQFYGCIGLVIFSDPLNYGGYNKHSWYPGLNDSNGYPNTWWLPKTGFQRGSLHMGGDPETMFYPSLNVTYRDEPNHLPQIPVQPISFLDAYSFLSILGGKEAPENWQGGFNFTYKVGGMFVEPYTTSKVELHVGNYVVRKTIHNVIGYIYGEYEPDRYVLFGNHRDAWEFGGADPSSGTAVLLETARAIGKVMKQTSWRPKRTIMFCNWGAEEHGLIGSTEWVEEYEKKLIQRAVAYINIDIAVQGNATFRASATPTLYQLLYDTTKNIPNPNKDEVKQGRLSVYDTWLHVHPDELKINPWVRMLGSGSDYTMFVQRAGVASIDMRYTFDHFISSYPVYHSLHDSFEYFEKFLDPGFEYSFAMAEISVDLLIKLSSSKILPLNPIDYAYKLHKMHLKLKNNFGKKLEAVGISLENLNFCIERLKASIINFNKTYNKHINSIQLRQLNDKLFYLDRAFLDFTGIPGREKFRHVVFAPGKHDSYSGSGFPGVLDSIYEAEHGASYEKVKKQLSVLCVHILAAANVLE